MTFVLNVLLVYFPAFIANASPLVVTMIPWVRKYNAPVWMARLGAHKTWMGLIGGIIAGMICGAILDLIPLSSVAPTADAMYDDLGFSVFFGGLLGAGALLGDAIESMFKRTIGIPSGGALPVLDTIDYVTGALLIALPFFVPTFWEGLTLLFLGWFLSTGTNAVSYAVGIKKVWY